MPDREADQASAPYAVLFKAHFWDSFVQRQFDRLRARVGAGHVYVVVDETRGPVKGIGHDRVFSFTEGDLTGLGLADRTESGTLLWYNNDYAHACFLHHTTPYPYYVTVEYDAVVNLDIDRLVEAAARDRMDFIGFPAREDVTANIWYPPHAALYGADAVHHYLNCVGLYSRAAMEFLLRRRLEMSVEQAAGQVPFWPQCELFIPSELAANGYRLGSLTDYGSTAHYQWWPPLEEAELAALPEGTFVHPVLEGRRYIASTLKHMPTRDLFTYFRPGSMVQRRLSRYARGQYMPSVRREMGRRARETVPRMLRKMGLMRRWG